MQPWILISGSSCTPRPSTVGVQSLSCTRLFATLRAAGRQASLSFTISRSLLTLVSIESRMPSNRQQSRR